MPDPVWTDGVTPLNAANMVKLQTRDEKAAANGYPSLDATGKVPLAQLPALNQTLGELAYGEFTAPVTCPAVSEATATPVVSAPAITLDGFTPIVIDVFIPVVGFSDAPDAVAYLFEDSTSLGAVWGRTSSTVVVGTNHGFIRVSRRLTPAAGSHTYSFRAKVSSGAGVQMIAGPGGPNQYTPGYIRVSLAAPISNAPAGALLPVQYGTSLPTSPVDGQEAILVDSLTNPTYQWRFRYNAGSSSTYKWEFVGGSPILSNIGAYATTTSTSYVDLAGAPQITVPRSGRYQIQFGSEAGGAAGDGGRVSPASTGLAANDGIAINLRSSVGNEPQAGDRVIQNDLIAAAVLKLQFRSELGGATYFIAGYISLIPVRVA